MAFENIGIGGILTFESRGAVANMGMAQRAFHALGRTAAGVSAGVSKVGAGMAGLFGGLTMVGGAAIAGVGYGIQKWIRSGIDFNKEMETSELAIATILSTVKKTPLEGELLNAKQAMLDLNRVAAEAPGELTDIVGIFQQMAGPLTVGKADMQDMYKATKGTAILAGLLKRSFNDTGAAMSKLTAGQMEMGNDIHMMLKSMGLITESTAEWKALLPEQRVKRVMQMLKTFEGSGERVGKTWEATSSTTSSLIKMLAGSFTRKMFDNMTSGLTNFNDKFFKNQKMWLDKAGEFGAKFGQAIHFVVAQVKDVGADIVKLVRRVQKRFEGLGMTIDNSILKQIASVAVKVAAVAVAMSPVITVVGFLGSKLMAVASIASGLVSILSAVLIPLAPFIAGAAALFLLFRRDGEPVMQTFGRALAYIKEVGTSLWNGMQPGIKALTAAFYTARDAARSMWEHIQPGLEHLKQSLAGLVTFAGQVFTTLFNMASKTVAAMASIWATIEPGVSKIFNALSKFVHTLVDGLNYLWPKVAAILEPIWNVILDVFQALAKVFNKLMEFMAPIIDGLTWLWKEILIPVAGFVLDVFGPIVVAAFKAIGAAVEAVLFVIGKVIDGMKWLAEKAGAILGKVKDGLGAAKDFLFGGPSMIEMMQAMKKSTADVNAMVNQTADNLAFQMGLAKLAAMGAQEVVMMVAQGLASLYNDTLKPIAETGLQLMNVFKGDAEIQAKQPDVKVDVNVNNKSTMCVNGRNLAVAQGAYETEVSERSGFNRTPWQTQRVQITGVKP